MRLPDRPYAIAATRFFERVEAMTAEAAAAQAGRLVELYDEAADWREQLGRPDPWEPGYAHEVRIAVQSLINYVSTFMARDPADPDFITGSRKELEQYTKAARLRLEAYYSRPMEGKEQ